MFCGSVCSHPKFAGGVRSVLSSPRCIEQEPCATFRLVDPAYDQAGRGHIAMLVADITGLPHAMGER